MLPWLKLWASIFNIFHLIVAFLLTHAVHTIELSPFFSTSLIVCHLLLHLFSYAMTSVQIKKMKKVVPRTTRLLFLVVHQRFWLSISCCNPKQHVAPVKTCILAMLLTFTMSLLQPKWPFLFQICDFLTKILVQLYYCCPMFIYILIAKIH